MVIGQIQRERKRIHKGPARLKERLDRLEEPRERYDKWLRRDYGLIHKG